MMAQRAKPSRQSTRSQYYHQSARYRHQRLPQAFDAMIKQ